MKTRAIITILISLVVGFILGFLTEGQIVKSARNKWHKVSYSQLFENRVIHIIDPTDIQKEQIIPIIKSYALKMSELRGTTREKFTELRNQMNNELKQFLTDEQYTRLVTPPDRSVDRKESSRHDSSSNNDKQINN